jgi:hypothetical protein
MLTSTAVFDQVASGRLTPEQGTEELLERRTRMPPQQPDWMPRWLYVGLVLSFFVVFAPVLRSGQRR